MPLYSNQSSASLERKSAKAPRSRMPSSRKGPLSAEYVVDESSDECGGHASLADTNHKKTTGSGSKPRKRPSSSSESPAPREISKYHQEGASKRSLNSTGPMTAQKGPLKSIGPGSKEKIAKESARSEVDTSPGEISAEDTSIAAGSSDSGGSTESETTSEVEGSGSQSTTGRRSTEVEKTFTQAKNGKAVAVQRAASPQQPPAELHASDVRPVRPFDPPVGFKPVEENEPPQLSREIADVKMPGKRIWYITAPSSVPLSGLLEVDLTKVARGEPVLRHNGQDYMFTEDTEDAASSNKVVVVHGNEARIVTSNIHEVFHLQQQVRLPTLPRAASEPSVSTRENGRREQPEGLKMRYRPSGFGDLDPGDIGMPPSETDIVASQPFHLPPDFRVFGPSRKRKVGDAEVSNSGREKCKKPDDDHGSPSIAPAKPSRALHPDKTSDTALRRPDKAKKRHKRERDGDEDDIIGRKGGNGKGRGKGSQRDGFEGIVNGDNSRRLVDTPNGKPNRPMKVERHKGKMREKQRKEQKLGGSLTS